MADVRTKIREVIDNQNVIVEKANISKGYNGSTLVEVGTNSGRLWDGDESTFNSRTILRLKNVGDIGHFKVKTNHTENVHIGDSEEYKQYTFLIIEAIDEGEQQKLSDALLFASRQLKMMAGFRPDRYYDNELRKTPYNKYEKFFQYILDLKALYDSTHSLRNMSEIAKKYHCKGVTKEQFFQYGIDKCMWYTLETTTELYDKIFGAE